MTALEKPAAFRDAWFVLSALVAAAAYVALPFLQPTGENWGRGWNLVAFWLYSAPLVGIAGLVMIWRLSRNSAAAGVASWLLPVAAFAYPLVAYLVIRSK